MNANLKICTQKFIQWQAVLVSERKILNTCSHKTNALLQTHIKSYSFTVMYLILAIVRNYFLIHWMNLIIDTEFRSWLLKPNLKPCIKKLRPFLNNNKEQSLSKYWLISKANKSTYLHYKKTGTHNLTQEKQQSLQNMKIDNLIIICKPDKGQGVAV